MAKKKVKLPSCADLEYLDLSVTEKRSVQNYVKGRVRQLKESRAEAAERKWTFSDDFLFGRQVEAESILAMIEKFNTVLRKKL